MRFSTWRVFGVCTCCEIEESIRALGAAFELHYAFRRHVRRRCGCSAPRAASWRVTSVAHASRGRTHRSTVARRCGGTCPTGSNVGVLIFSCDGARRNIKLRSKQTPHRCLHSMKLVVVSTQRNEPSTVRSCPLFTSKTSLAGMLTIRLEDAEGLQGP